MRPTGPTPEVCWSNKAKACRSMILSGALIEANMLALVAYRVGKELTWDRKSLSVPGCPEADQYIRKTYRKGWALNG